MTKADALHAYASMMNTLELKHLEPLLADDFHYSSQWVSAEITSKPEFVDYARQKLAAIAESGSKAYAEMAEIKDTHPVGPCVVVAQNRKDNLVGTVFAEVKDGFITRLDMCCVPPPTAAIRSGIYPGLREKEPSTPEVDLQTLKQRAVDAFNEGKFSDALDDFTKAIELAPKNAQLYWCRGVTLSRLELYQKAIEDFDRSIEMNPQNEGKYDHNPSFTDREKAYSALRALSATGTNRCGMLLIRKRNGAWLRRWRSLIGMHQPWKWSPINDLKNLQEMIIRDAENLDSILREALAIIDGSSETFELKSDGGIRRRKKLELEGGECFTMISNRFNNLEKAVKLIKSGKWSVQSWRVPEAFAGLSPFMGEYTVKSEYLIAIAGDDAIAPSEVIV